MRESPRPIVARRRGDARQDFWENPGFSNHNSAYLAMRLLIEIMRHSAYPQPIRPLGGDCPFSA
jgi:hypothetical protein